MKKYSIKKKANNSWNPDGSPIWERTISESNNFKDIIREAKSISCTTDSLNAYVFGLTEEPVKIDYFYGAIDLIENFPYDDRHNALTKKNILENLMEYYL